MRERRQGKLPGEEAPPKANPDAMPVRAQHLQRALMKAEWAFMIPGTDHLFSFR
jgi:hypothetical protein